MNNSWGGGDFSQALEDAIEQTDASGELFVAAAGNDFTNTDSEPFWPSSYDTPNIISVGASDQFDRKAWFSNYGVRTVDLSAPGTNVYSTWKVGGYRFADGTSMAAPHVSGAAALVEGGVPECERCRPEGAPPAHGRPDRRPEWREQDRGSPQRRPRRPLHRPAGLDRVAGQRRRAERGRSARGAGRRRAVRLAGRRLGDRDAEREPVPARRARGRPLHGDLHAGGGRDQPDSHRELRNLVRHAERLRDGRPDVRDRPGRSVRSRSRRTRLERTRG